MAEAEVALAQMMVNGSGGRRDPFTARTLLEKAAKRGHDGAISALGALNSDRQDVPRNESSKFRG
jgi:TPR repeat protein